MDLDAVTAQLDALRERALAEISEAVDTPTLDRVDATYLGRSGGLINAQLGAMKQLPPEDRKRLGQAVNAAKTAVEQAIGERRARLEEIALEVRLTQERMDVTLPGRHLPVGSLHPYHETNREIARIFGQFGFVVYEGPEVETDELNFQALNIPLDHPARDLWDTMYVAHPVPADGGRYLLRTHTSPTQIRVMASVEPPIRALMPGRCFRYEAVDASHGSEFYQVEGLMIDEGTTLAHLRGLLDQFAYAMFGPRRTRFRPGYYPFTEPSVAFDVQCVICDGSGCPSCGRSGWMTILGAGMVHPHVIARGGLDPERYQGFAFGMGTDRIAMLRHDIHDLRVFLQNDLRVLEQL